MSNIGILLEKQNQPELAIVFLKQSVNVREEIRQGNRELLQEFQQSYTETVAITYRRLADLLLSKGRILEAQKVLELLKVEELREYTRGSVTDVGNRKINLTETESKIIAQYNSLIEFGSKIYACEQPQATCSEAELNQLYAQRTQLTTEYQNAVRSFEQEIRARGAQDPAFLNPELFSSEAQDILANAKTPTVLIYPIVLEQKLWILWATIGGNKSVITNAVEVNIDQATLSKDVVEFRRLMEACESRTCGSEDIPAVQAVSRRLDNALIPPQLVNEIERNQIQNLVFSLDRVTRYIPIAALFDGEQYLVQRYTVSTILSAGLTRRDNPLTPSPSNTAVLAFGLSEAVPADPTENLPAFRALEYVPNELDAIVQQGRSGIYPGQELLNQNFDLTALQNLAPRYQILHIATHGQFVPAAGIEQSYLVLGTKKPLRIPQIENMQQSFAGLSLVVLSACQTALGEAGADGIEIAGVAHSFIRAGVNTVLASLWQVEDRSTSVLMQQFYQNLSSSSPNRPVVLSEALRQAQLSLLTGHAPDGTPITRAPGTIVVAGGTTTSAAQPDYAHPYYWAPFILIGNGL